MTYPKICDISEYQPVIDWPRLAELGVGIIVRCGQSNFEDGRFQEHYAKALAAGVPVGIYFFFQPNLGPEVQITEFLRIYNGLAVKPKVISLDVENIAYTDANGTKINILPPSPEIHSVWLMQWLQAVEKATGITPGIYTRADYWDAWVRRSGTKKVNYNGTEYTMPDWSHYWLWIASWTNYSSDIRMPKDWKTWKVWQYEGGTGRQDGITGPVDLNSYNGTQDQMIEFFGAKSKPMTPSGIYKQTVTNANKATFTLFSDDDKTVPVDKITSDLIMLKMVGQDTGTMLTHDDTAFKIRAGRVTNRPVFGWVNLDANMFWNKEITLPVFQNRGMYDNETVKSILKQWRVNAFTDNDWNNKTLNLKADDGGWIKLSGLVFLLYVTTYKAAGTYINGLWQMALLMDQLKVFKTLMDGGYIPKVPMYVAAPAVFYKFYATDPTFANLKNVTQLSGIGIVETGAAGLFTEAPMTTPLETMADIFKYRPADSYQYSFIPDGINPMFCLYSQNRFRVSGFGGTLSVGLWSDTVVEMYKTLGYSGAITPPVEPPIEPPITPTDPDLAAVAARVTALEATVARLVAGAKISAG